MVSNLLQTSVLAALVALSPQAHSANIIRINAPVAMKIDVESGGEESWVLTSPSRVFTGGSYDKCHWSPDLVVMPIQVYTASCDLTLDGTQQPQEMNTSTNEIRAVGDATDYSEIQINKSLDGTLRIAQKNKVISDLYNCKQENEPEEYPLGADFTALITCYYDLSATMTPVRSGSISDTYPVKEFNHTFYGLRHYSNKALVGTGSAFEFSIEAPAEIVKNVPFTVNLIYSGSEAIGFTASHSKINSINMQLKTATIEESEVGEKTNVFTLRMPQYSVKHTTSWIVMDYIAKFNGVSTQEGAIGSDVTIYWRNNLPSVTKLYFNDGSGEKEVQADVGGKTYTFKIPKAGINTALCNRPDCNGYHWFAARVVCIQNAEAGYRRIEKGLTKCPRKWALFISIGHSF